MLPFCALGADDRLAGADHPDLGDDVVPVEDLIGEARREATRSAPGRRRRRCAGWRGRRCRRCTGRAGTAPRSRPSWRSRDRCGSDWGRRRAGRWRPARAARDPRRRDRAGGRAAAFTPVVDGPRSPPKPPAPRMNSVAVGGDQQTLVVLDACPSVSITAAFPLSHTSLTLPVTCTLRLGRNLAVQRDALLAVQQHRQVDLDVGHQAAHRQHAGDHRVGRQHLRPLALVDVLQLVLAGLAPTPRA